MTARWYALCSKPHKEEILFKQLQAREVEVFFPRLLAQTSSLNVLKVKPYFPGYLFIRVDLEKVGASTFQWMPYSEGLVSFVSFGERPIYVPDILIQAIQKRVVKMTTTVGEVLNSVTPGGKGDDNSPFVGYESILNTSLPGKERSRILFQMLQEMFISEGSAVNS